MPQIKAHCRRHVTNEHSSWCSELLRNRPENSPALHPPVLLSHLQPSSNEVSPYVLPNLSLPEGGVLLYDGQCGSITCRQLLQGMQAIRAYCRAVLAASNTQGGKARIDLQRQGIQAALHTLKPMLAIRWHSHLLQLFVMELPLCAAPCRHGWQQHRKLPVWEATRSGLAADTSSPAW